MSEKYPNKKEKLETRRIYETHRANLVLFKACCDFFDLTLDEFYILLHVKCDVSQYYATYNSFKIMWHKSKGAIAQKDGIIESVDELLSVLRNDVFKAMNSPKLLPLLKVKWNKKLEELMDSIWTE